jgi:hypothetical protein
VAVEAGRDQYPVFVGDRDGAAVERVMVDAATGDAVVESVGAAELTPTDVGGVEGDVGMVKLDAEAAEGTAVVPGGDYASAEGRVAAEGAGRSLEVETDGGGDTFVERFGEVGREQLAGKVADGFGTSFEVCIKFGREAAADFPFAELGPKGVAAALAAGERRLFVDLPDAVGLQVVEGQFGMDGFSWRAEVFEQPGEWRFDFVEGEQPGRTGMEAAEGEKD